MAEIFARGPVKASLHANSIRNYTGGIIMDDPALRNLPHNHGVSLVGWGLSTNNNDNDNNNDNNNNATKYWIIRNSWGQYWGEMGFFRLQMGTNMLSIEANVAWATPGTFSTYNFPCDENGDNCRDALKTQHYVDPSKDPDRLKDMFRTQR
mmetsp:Transcript_32712/g.50052  ORF Transcript_32712/g.50052 Transcript_32712/m.50052 type:complete len:151 (+) Transcript_32712:338-790(+)